MLARSLMFTLMSFVIIGLGYWMMSAEKNGAAPQQKKIKIAEAAFSCDGGKLVAATFYTGRAKRRTRNADSQPLTGSVELVLSGGRTLDLDQIDATTGARYSSRNGQIVFSNTGHGAYLLDNGERTYRECLAVAPDPGGLAGVYGSGVDGFSIRYPADYLVDPRYVYRRAGPSKLIHGVSFAVPLALATGTNLSADSYLSVETIPRVIATPCTADDFLPDGAPHAREVTDHGSAWSVATLKGAGAGNRYDETVFALSGSMPCRAIRYFVHYTVLANYPQGTVRAFDESALLAQFAAIRHSLIVE